MEKVVVTENELTGYINEIIYDPTSSVFTSEEIYILQQIQLTIKETNQLLMNGTLEINPDGELLFADLKDEYVIQGGKNDVVYKQIIAYIPVLKCKGFSCSIKNEKVYLPDPTGRFDIYLDSRLSSIVGWSLLIFSVKSIKDVISNVGGNYSVLYEKLLPYAPVITSVKVMIDGTVALVTASTAGIGASIGVALKLALNIAINLFAIKFAKDYIRYGEYYLLGNNRGSITTVAPLKLKLSVSSQ